MNFVDIRHNAAVEAIRCPAFVARVVTLQVQRILDTAAPVLLEYLSCQSKTSSQGRNALLPGQMCEAVLQTLQSSTALTAELQAASEEVVYVWSTPGYLFDPSRMALGTHSFPAEPTAG